MIVNFQNATRPLAAVYFIMKQSGILLRHKVNRKK